MFEVTVQAEFSAAHALMMRGQVEPVHGHNWLVTVTVAGPQLDGDGLLLDFHLVERHLRELATAWHNSNLNDHEPFSTSLNPSAENICRHIADELTRRLEGQLPPGASIASVRITEAPGCTATYFPPSTLKKQTQPA